MGANAEIYAVEQAQKMGGVSSTPSLNNPQRGICTEQFTSHNMENHMEQKHKFHSVIFTFIGKVFSCLTKGILILLILSLGLISAKVVSRWNKPMIIPEAHGMSYGELIQNRLDGWNHNQELYGEPALNCKIITLGGITLSLPAQIIYTYAGYNPDSQVINLIDPRDIRAGYIPQDVKFSNLFESWWWTVEKFSWGLFVEGVEHSAVRQCKLPIPLLSD